MKRLYIAGLKKAKKANESQVHCVYLLENDRFSSIILSFGWLFKFVLDHSSFFLPTCIKTMRSPHIHSSSSLFLCISISLILHVSFIVFFFHSFGLCFLPAALSPPFCIMYAQFLTLTLSIYDMNM